MLENVEDLAGLLADARLAGFVIGGGEVANVFPDFLFSDQGVGLPSAPFNLEHVGGPADWNWEGLDAWLPIIQKAADDLRGRRLLLKTDWDAATVKSRQESFTVAYLDTEKAIGKVRDAVVEATEKGLAFPAFKERVKERFGESPLGIGHLESVFRTNVMEAYSRGMDHVLENPMVDDYFPFEETIPILDSRTTELCRVIAKSGIQGTGIYLRSDPVYRHFKPPRHHNCRDGRRPMDVRTAARRGIVYAQEWLKLGEQPPNPPFVDYPPVELPPGWTPRA